MVGTGAGLIGAAPTTTLGAQSRQVEPSVLARATARSVLPAVPAFTVKGIATLDVVARAVVGTVQVRVLPSIAVLARRVPIVASSRTSLRSTVTMLPVCATLPVLRLDSV